MLGKAEYIKYVLKSICEERIRYFLSKVVLNQISEEVNKNSSSNPCCKFKDFTFFLKDANGEYIESGDGRGDQVIDTEKATDLETLEYNVGRIYDAAEGVGSGDLAELGKQLTPAERCWICRKSNIFKNGKAESLISFIGDEGEEYDAFIKDLKCTDFGFQSNSGNGEGQTYVKNSFMDLLNQGKCTFEPSSDFLVEIKNTSVVGLIDKYDLYQKFINRIPTEYQSLYRFAAFVSDNIGKINKDNFDIKKTDNTAVLHANEFIQKSELKNFEKVPGEWHLQKLFIEQLQILKESL